VPCRGGRDKPGNGNDGRRGVFLIETQSTFLKEVEHAKDTENGSEEVRRLRDSNTFVSCFSLPSRIRTFSGLCSRGICDDRFCTCELGGVHLNVVDTRSHPLRLSLNFSETHLRLARKGHAIQTNLGTRHRKGKERRASDRAFSVFFSTRLVSVIH